MRLTKRSLRKAAFFGYFFWITHSNAATFSTFVDNSPAFLAAIGSGTIATNEDFKTATNLKPIGSLASPDRWNGFTVESHGTNIDGYWSPSKYCTALNSGSSNLPRADSCIWWNTAAPAVSGIFAGVNINNGISFKPIDTTTAAFSFNFVDWNDLSERSHLIVTASDSTSTVVSGPANAINASPQSFGVTLAPADIAAGLYIKEILWIGKDNFGEVVGFYNIQTYTNPVITNRPPTANPDSYTMVGDSLNLSLTDNDTDPDADHLQVTRINDTYITPGIPQSIQVSGGTIEISAIGIITFSFDSNKPDPVSIRYEISDGRGGTANSTADILPKIESNPVLPINPITPVTPVAPISANPPANPDIAAVPSFGEWGIIALSSLMALAGISRSNRRWCRGDKAAAGKLL